MKRLLLATIVATMLSGCAALHAVSVINSAFSTGESLLRDKGEEK